MDEFSLLGTAEQAELLGDRVRSERLARNLTQRTLADRAGVSVPTVQRLEGGGGTLRSFLSILSALGRAADLDPVLLPRRPGTLDQALETPPTRQRGRR